MTTPAPNPRSTPPPGTYEAWRLGCRCFSAGQLLFDESGRMWKYRMGAIWYPFDVKPPPPHKPGCVLAKERQP